MFRTSPVHLQERFVQAVFADFWYVVIRVLLDTSSRYKVVGRTVLYFWNKNYNLDVTLTARLVDIEWGRFFFWMEFPVTFMNHKDEIRVCLCNTREEQPYPIYSRKLVGHQETPMTACVIRDTIKGTLCTTVGIPKRLLHYYTKQES